MKNFFDKIFFRFNNFDLVSSEIKKITKKSNAYKIIEAIDSFSESSEIRYVGGCIRKILRKEEIDDLDFATNLEPNDVCNALKSKEISYYESGIKHGTITAVIDDLKYEITSLREDVSTDGRHAVVKFSKNWKMDSLRRDFTINSIYSDKGGNIFDPHNGVKDLEIGEVKFIGDPDRRIREDYLRILRYIRFFLSYSKQPHDPKVIKIIKINIGGISKLSKERLLDELKKMFKIEILKRLSVDKISVDLLSLIFPELINLRVFSNLNFYSKEFLHRLDFILFLSISIVDEKDNAEYFLYKYNLSKNDQKRIRNINNNLKNITNLKQISEKTLNKIFYYQGKQAVLDILNFKIINSKKLDLKLKNLIELFENKQEFKMPIKTEELIVKYKIPRDKTLGNKIKMIEETWVKNDFKISEKELANLLKN